MKLVILERDGVITPRNGKPGETLPGSIDALARLHNAGYTLVIATNQSGIAEGSLDLDALETLHDLLTQQVEAAGAELAAIFYCPHGPDDQCKCRKPQPGMLDAIEAEFNLSVTGAPVIGDSPEDIVAAQAKGAHPLLVLTGNGEATAAQWTGPKPDTYHDLSAAVDHLLQTKEGS